jgi:hypothetical protein
VAHAGRRNADELLAAGLAAGQTVREASAAAGRLVDGMTEAANVLRALLSDADPHVRHKAAVKLLEVTMKFKQMAVLHTGIRALRTERRWWGSTSEKPRVIELNPAAPIPAGITLLSVEGDAVWDRIAPDTRLDVPRLFAPNPTKVS